MFLMKRFRGKLQNDKGFLITVALTIAYVILLTFYSILKHYSFKTYAHDLGIYSQALNTFLKGDFFYETPDLIHNPSGSFFGVHFSPILFMIVPLYAIYPHPETLFFIQSLFLGLAAIVPISSLQTSSLISKAKSHGCYIVSFTSIHPRR